MRIIPTIVKDANLEFLLEIVSLPKALQFFLDVSPVTKNKLVDVMDFGLIHTLPL